MWPGPLSCTTWTKRDCQKKKSDIKDRKRICAERSPSFLRHIRFPYVASLKSYVRVVYIQEDSQRPAPSWLVNSIGRALHLYRSTQLGTRGFSRVRREFSVLAEGRSHEPETALEKSLAPRLSFATAKKCLKNAMIFFHVIQLTLLKVLKTFEANVSAARPWVRCLTHGAFHVPYTTYIPAIGVLVSQSFGR